MEKQSGNLKANFSEIARDLGISGWLTNYKRFHVLPEERRLHITIGDLEHFASYITRRDVDYIASLGMDHIRLGFDQIVLEEAPVSGVKKFSDIWITSLHGAKMPNSISY